MDDQNSRKTKLLSKKNIWEAVRFSASSFVSYLMDYGVYTLLVLLTGQVVMSNVISRTVGSTINFFINRFIVFKNKDSLWKAALKFAVLQACIVFCNSMVLRFFVETLGIHKLLAKPMVDMIFFGLNFLFQRTVVFRRKKAEARAGVSAAAVQERASSQAGQQEDTAAEAGTQTVGIREDVSRDGVPEGGQSDE